MLQRNIADQNYFKKNNFAEVLSPRSTIALHYIKRGKETKTALFTFFNSKVCDNQLLVYKFVRLTVQLRDKNSNSKVSFFFCFLIVFVPVFLFQE